VNDRIKANLIAAARVGYLPISFSDLKIENREIADLAAVGCLVDSDGGLSSCART